MEGILSEALTASLLEEKLFSINQHGFLPKRSTVTQLLTCLNDWTKALDDGQVIDVIYLDIAMLRLLLRLYLDRAPISFGHPLSR